MKIYQKLDNDEFPRRPIWIDNENGTSTWREGQVTLTAVTGYQVRKQSQTKWVKLMLVMKDVYTLLPNSLILFDIFNLSLLSREKLQINQL
jgi:hypothetical protein